MGRNISLRGLLLHLHTFSVTHSACSPTVQVGIAKNPGYVCNMYVPDDGVSPGWVCLKRRYGYDGGSYIYFKPPVLKY